MTQRELLALCAGLVLLLLGWTISTGSERGPEGSGELAGAAASEAERAGDAPLFADGGVEARRALRAEAQPAQERAAEKGAAEKGGADGADVQSSAPRRDTEPSLEPRAWPLEGLYVRVTKSDGELAVGAPIGVWVVGGRSPLGLLESDAEGRVHFVDIPALAARYEVGLAAPGVQRVGWPAEATGRASSAGNGLAPTTPLQIGLPPCGTLEVQVVRASWTGTLVEIGAGTAAGFRVAQVRAAELDGVARFRWLPLGLELTLRVAFAPAVVEVIVPGPVAMPALGATPATSDPVMRRVRVGPEGVLEG